MLNECGICRQRRDQHLLAKCDTCHLYYHLNCLNPPLTRLPKKSKLYGWQCSECDKSSDSEVDVKEKGPRRSRTRHSKDNNDLQNEVFTPKVKIKPVEPQYPLQTSPPNHVSHPYSYPYNNNAPVNSSVQISNTLVCTTTIEGEMNNEQCYIIGGKSGKKRRRDKHRSRNSPEDGLPSREHKRKRKKKSLDIENPNNNSHPRITIKVFIYTVCLLRSDFYLSAYPF